jgi:hypothetical protein
MLRSKYFWIALVILGPFIFIWSMEGIGWAVAALVVVGLMFLLITGAARRRPRYYYRDDDGSDREELRVRRNASAQRRGLTNMHVPRVNPKSTTWVSNTRRRDQATMRRIKKNLWG